MSYIIVSVSSISSQTDGLTPNLQFSQKQRKDLSIEVIPNRDRDLFVDGLTPDLPLSETQREAIPNLNRDNLVNEIGKKKFIC